jgi:glycine/D-amino acid oxidase-like deaminating enzyme
MIRKSATREAAFYREQLQLIADGQRNTRERRLARSALTFWDEMDAQRRRKPNQVLSK